MKSFDFPIIFLDIDGVLTSMFETPGSFLNHKNDEYGISPTCFNYLLKLCKETSAKIIISSNWRKFDDDGPKSLWLNPNTNTYVKNQLPKLKNMLGELCIGTLPKIRHITKSEALKLWFDENNLNYKTLNYVIFDDDLNEEYQLSKFKNKFILTNIKTGLTEKDYKNALHILKHKK